MTSTQYLTTVLATAFISVLVGCSNNSNQEDAAHAHETHGDHAPTEVHLSDAQFEAMHLKVDSLAIRNVSPTVSVNGQLQVPPQHEAAVTAIVGANISQILVLEGDSVSKGQVLAYLQHPDLVVLQTDYVQHWNNLQFLEQEIARQQKLYDAEVGSGKQLQQTRSDYLTEKGRVAGMEAQFEMLGMNPEPLRRGEIFTSVPVRSPITGFVRKVLVKTGQFVQPQTEMFDVVNVDHLHADFMVFEKDMHKVKVGQGIRFSTASGPEEELTGHIYAVGKAFEQQPKALHLHAHIDEKAGLLLPGMYIQGEILLGDSSRHALPEEAVVREGGKYYIFSADKHKHGTDIEWAFTPVEVIPLNTDRGWTSFELIKNRDGVFLWNSAYYLMAELKKGEEGGEHRH